MLYTCHWVLDAVAAANTVSATAPLTKSSGLRGYKPSHKNHPCGKWVRASLSNYRWLTRFCSELCREYSFRYGGKIHGCAEHVKWLHANPPAALEDIGFTQPAQAMPEEYRHQNSVVAYRRYYTKGKAGILKYTGRHQPQRIP